MNPLTSSGASPGVRPQLPSVGRMAPAGSHAVDAAPMAWRLERPPQSADMAALYVQAWRFVSKCWPLLAIATAAGLALGLVVTLLTPPAYTARVTLQIDRQAERVVNNEDQTPIDNLGEEFFQTQYGLLKSHALAARVADSLGLAHDDAFRNVMLGKPHGYAWPAADVGRRREAIVGLLQSGLTISPERGSRLVGVGFTSPDAQLSARIANSFGENFIGAALDRRYEASAYARDFLETRLAEVKAKLEASERDLVAYAASQQIIQLPTGGQPGAPDAGGPSLPAANLEAFNSALATARTERIKAEQKWREAQASPGSNVSDILQSPTFQALSQEHAKLSAEYQDKLRTFKPDYPDMLALKARIDETSRQMGVEAAGIRDALRAQYETALASETALSAQVSSLKASVLDLRGRSIRYNILQREVDTNRTLYDGLLQRYKEVGVAGGVSANNISVVDRAEPPTRPSSPRPLINLSLAGIAGLGIGLGIALLRENLDQAVRTPADLEERLGLPMLGAVPALRRGARPAEALADARSPMAEAYQTVRSALQFSTPQGFPKTMLVTSPWPGTGKTTTAFAISRYVARLGFRVLLIEGDLRNPNVGELVGAERATGLSTFLTGAASLEDVTQPTNLANLFVVTAGPPAPNPAELLGGSRLPLLVAETSASYDMVIFDGPPIMGLADAPIIGAAVEGSIIVVEAGRSTHKQVKEAQRRMAMAGARVLGAVLNRAKEAAREAGYGYGAYAYGYGYDAEKATDRARMGFILGLSRRLLPR